MAKDKDVARMIDWWEGESALDPVKRNAYWRALSSARREFNQSLNIDPAAPLIDTSLRFKIWVEEAYGIEMHYQGTNISGQFKVTDEQKYTIFLLKHGAQ